MLNYLALKMVCIENITIADDSKRTYDETEKLREIEKIKTNLEN